MLNVEVPGFGVIQFDEGTPDSTMQRVASQAYARANPAPSPEQAPAPESWYAGMVRKGYLPGGEDLPQVALALGGAALPEVIGGLRGMADPAAQTLERGGPLGRYLASKIPFAHEARLGMDLMRSATPAAEEAVGAARIPPGATAVPAPAASAGAAGAGAFSAPTVAGQAVEQAAEHSPKVIREATNYWRRRAMATLSEAGAGEEAASRQAISKILGREIKSRTELTAEDWLKVHEGAGELLSEQAAAKAASQAAARAARKAGTSVAEKAASEPNVPRVPSQSLKQIGKDLEWIKSHVAEEIQPAATRRFLKNVPPEFMEAAKLEARRLFGAL